MAIPNLIGLLLLTKELKRLTADFDSKIKSGELRK
jgi:AGCS family alanine or glycine:cation symporter